MLPWLLIGLALAAPLQGAEAPASADTVRVTDDRGRAFVRGAPPARIVSLAPTFTEILYALGAGDRLVGRTRFARHPPEAEALPSVGDGIRPSLESVAARRPDVVLLYAGAANRGVAERLEAAGIPVLAFRHDGLADLEENVERLGALTACRRTARGLRRALRRGLSRVAEATATGPRRRVYYDVWSDPPITVGRGSYLDSLLTLAGAENVFGDVASASPRVSLEAILARSPEVILWPVEGEDPDARTHPASRPGWSTLEPVRHGDVRRVDADLVHRLGPRIVEAAWALARAVHPDLASEPGDAASPLPAPVGVCRP